MGNKPSSSSSCSSPPQSSAAQQASENFYSKQNAECATVRNLYANAFELYMAGGLPFQHHHLLDRARNAVMHCNYIQGYWDAEHYRASLKDPKNVAPIL